MKIDGLPREVDTILLDYDGTIIDIRPKWWEPVEKAFLDTAGYVPEEKLRANVGTIMQKIPNKPSKFFMMKLMWSLGREGGLSRLDTLKFLRKSRKNYAESRYLNIPIDGALEFIKMVKAAGIDLAIVTTASRKEIDNAIDQIEELQGTLAISRDDVENLKPHPEPLETALYRLQKEPNNTVMIGDFSSDIVAGKNAGTMTIGLSSYVPEVSLPGIQRVEPDLIVPFLKDLIPLVSEN